MNKTLPKIALGAWSWGAGVAGGDQIFGNHLFEKELEPVFDKAMELGLNLWDTAAVCGEGTSERILGNFVKDVRREDVIISTKFTPQIASDSPDAMQEMLDGSKVEEAAAAAQVVLTAEEIIRLEKLGDETGVHTLRQWEKEMI